MRGREIGSQTPWLIGIEYYARVRQVSARVQYRRYRGAKLCVETEIRCCFCVKEKLPKVPWMCVDYKNPMACKLFLYPHLVNKIGKGLD